MKNSELLRYQSKEGLRLLTEIQRQRLYVLKKALCTLACPHCLNPVNQIEASGKSMDEFDLDGGTDAFACPHCGTELVEVVPFMPSGSPYTWRRKTPANRTYSEPLRVNLRGAPPAEYRRAFGRPLFLDIETRSLNAAGEPLGEWHPLTPHEVAGLHRHPDGKSAVEHFARMADETLVAGLTRATSLP